MKQKIIIYGASTSARNIKNLLDCFDIEVYCFVVTRLEGNPTDIDGIPVYEASVILPMQKDALVLIALLREHYDSVKTYLEEIGVKKYMEAGLESDVDIRLRRAYFRRKFGDDARKMFLVEMRTSDRALVTSEMQKSCEKFKVFMVRNHKDRVIAECPLEEWLVPIQAGAANTDVVLAEIRDNQGENTISARNYNYCELTAAYWMWRNVDIKYIGLCHYRRKFLLTQELVLGIMEKNIDICVPLPGLLSPNVREAYINMSLVNPRYGEDLDRMLQAIAECRPEYLDCAKAVLAGQEFIHYNMMIAKKEVFYKWCEFWYPVLRWVEESYETDGIHREDRYLGLLGELLTTIFVYYHSEYKILYTEILFLT